MPEEDHKLKVSRSYCHRRWVKAEEEKLIEHEDKVREFEWGDVDEETEETEETEGKLLVVSEDSVKKCYTMLADHLLSVISGEHFSELNTSGMKFVIPVDPGMHVLLRNRFEEEWDLDSRLDMFMEVKEGLAFEFAESSEKRVKLDAKILEALPATHRKKLTPTEVSLEDDAMVVNDESNMLSIEIPLAFEANA